MDEVNFDTGWLHVGFQVKNVGGHLVFAPPKRGKVRDIPLAPAVALAFKEHAERFPPTAVTLPWLRPDGAPVTKKLMFTAAHGGAVRRSDFNTYAWKPALVGAGVLPERVKGKRHQAAREDGMHALRHFFGSRPLAWCSRSAWGGAPGAWTRVASALPTGWATVQLSVVNG
ncbi:hypothetical protein ACEZDJ_36795, partial [Streptacidiphilus sp. N1-5]